MEPDKAHSTGECVIVAKFDDHVLCRLAHKKQRANTLCGEKHIHGIVLAPPKPNIAFNTTK